MQTLINSNFLPSKLIVCIVNIPSIQTRLQTRDQDQQGDQNQDQTNKATRTKTKISNKTRPEPTPATATTQSGDPETETTRNRRRIFFTTPTQLAQDGDSNHTPATSSATTFFIDTI